MFNYFFFELVAATEIVSRRFQGKSLDGWWTSAAIDGEGKENKEKKARGARTSLGEQVTTRN